MIRRLHLSALFLASLVLMSPALAGNLDKVLAYDIDAPTLDKALLQFGAQAHVQISFAWNPTTSGRRTRKLKGTYSGKEVLAQLLKGTGLKYSAAGDTVSILPDPMTRSTAPARSSHTDTSESSARGTENLDPPMADQRSESVQPTQGLREVIVTAQKYEQSAFDVPISLAVVTARELQRLNISSLNDLQYDVPGLYVEGGNVFNYIVLRGVSNSAGNGALVGEYVDEADVSAAGFVGQVGYGAGDVSLYDLQRVEVLKGPQGTLYGDGSLGGVIRYITNSPVLDRDEMNAEISTLFTQYGAPSQSVKAMLNVPLVSDTVGFRIAGQFRHDGGWVDDPMANAKNINGVTLTDVRMEGLWRPNSHFRARIMQIIRRGTYGIGAGEDAQGNVGSPFGVASLQNGSDNLNLSNITLTADFTTMELLSSTSYFIHSEAVENTFTISPQFASLIPYQPLTNETISEEFRLHSRTAGRWQWTLGAFYKHFLETYGVNEYYGSPGPLSTASNYSSFGDWDHSNSEALFADTSLRLLERLTLGAGARYFRDRFSSASQTTFIDDVPTFPPEAAQQSFTSVDPRAYIQYGITSHANVYASAAKGFRSGEPNLGLGEGLGFNPEGLWSYDLGTKLRFFHGYLRSDADAFYEKYSNYVGDGLITVDGVPFYGAFNIGSANIKGVDADVEWWVKDQWRFSGKGEVVSSKFSSITGAETGFLPGERLPYVPPYTFTVSAEREFKWNTRPVFALISYSQTARVDGYSYPVVSSDVIRFLNFKVGMQWAQNIGLSVFVQNLLNDRGYLDPNWSNGDAYRPRPRTFGVDFNITSN